MGRQLGLCNLFLLALACSAPAGTPPGGHAIIDTEAIIRTAPPELKPTGRRIPYGTAVAVAEEKTVDGKAYVRVHERGDPKPELGWTARSGLGSGKEFAPAMRPEDAADDAHLSGLKRTMAAYYNTRGKYLGEQARLLGASPAMLAAVLKVESGGQGFGPDGRVTVRFENHVFWARWGSRGADNTAAFARHFEFDAKERWKGHRWRKAASDPWAPFHGSQAREWEVLEFAKALDEDAALASASYGVGQIMGFNHRAVGYASAREMVKKFDEGIKPQLDAMIAFVKGNKKCVEGLVNKDYTRFAEGYNGAGKAAAYGGRIRDAADAYAEVTKGKKYAE